MTYEIVLERDESGAWLAQASEIPGCHTWGRSLREVRRRIREALALWVDDADETELEFVLRLPRDVRHAVHRGKTARERSAREAARAQRELQKAIEALERAGFSRRDTAELLDLSHQRVQQVANGSR